MKNIDFGQHFRKISILVHIFDKIDSGQTFPEILVC